MFLSNEPLGEILTTGQGTATLSDAKSVYLDANHPMFSRELSIAIEAWEQVLSSNPKSPNTGSRKKLITDWLKTNHKGLENAAIERIAVMLNPDKNGGAPKIN